jgi:hypothetical protein
MKNLLFLIIICFPKLIFCQSNDEIILKWKISKNDTIIYNTKMNSISKNDRSINEKNSIHNSFNQLKESLNQINSNLKYQTKLFENSKNINHIDIEMSMIEDNSDLSNVDFDKMIKKLDKKNKKSKKNEIEEKESILNDFTINFMNSFKNNIVLRGRISKSGEVISNYYKNAQKNLISILFELPNKPVRIGESWSLNNNLIQMDQNFIADSINSSNKIYIEKIIEQNGEKIAIIKYNIYEYVDGNFNNPFGSTFGMKNNEHIFMKTTYSATGHFSLTKGKWIIYEGIMEIDSNFSMSNGKTITEYKLIEN